MTSYFGYTASALPDAFERTKKAIEGLRKELGVAALDRDVKTVVLRHYAAEKDHRSLACAASEYISVTEKIKGLELNIANKEVLVLRMDETLKSTQFALDFEKCTIGDGCITEKKLGPLSEDDEDNEEQMALKAWMLDANMVGKIILEWPAKVSVDGECKNFVPQVGSWAACDICAFGGRSPVESWSVLVYIVMRSDNNQFWVVSRDHSLKLVCGSYLDAIASP